MPIAKYYALSMAKAHRQYPRIPFRVPLEYEGFERFKPDRTLNLSRGGLFILTSKPLEIGERVIVYFELPELHFSVRATGTVVWRPGPSASGAGARHPQGMGIAFDPLVNDRIMHVIDQYVTVGTALKSLDVRIGTELPPYIFFDLPQPSENSEAEVRLLDVTLPVGMTPQ